MVNYGKLGLKKTSKTRQIGMSINCKTLFEPIQTLPKKNKRDSIKKTRSDDVFCLGLTKNKRAKKSNTMKF